MEFLRAAGYAVAQLACELGQSDEHIVVHRQALGSETWLETGSRCRSSKKLLAQVAIA